MINSYNNRPLVGALGIFLIIVIIELLAIFSGNAGGFSYTLDDPYIHLALSENILQGHYGVNMQEYSSPSSSILWPFLLLPVVIFPHADLILLFLNVSCSLACITVFYSILLTIDTATVGEPISNKAYFLLLAFFILVSNLVGLNFLGMEHVIQLLAVLLIILGIFKFNQQGVITKVTWLAIIIAPLIRYECLAVSGAALLYFFWHRHYVKTVAVGFMIIFLLAAFSFFLLAIGQEYLPSSILVKSAVVNSGIDKLTVNLKKNFVYPQAWIMLFGMMILLFKSASASLALADRKLAVVSALAVFFHLMVGRFGWYFRYEIYMWIMEILVLVYLHRQYLKQVIVEKRKKPILILALVFFIPVEFHIESIVYGYRASGNIYYQQYQMHRYITDYYQDSVAVNDLGWVSYNNDNYVLDLWGLASREAHELRTHSHDVQWLVDIVNKHDVGLIMIYQNHKYFPEVPEQWIKIGQLKLKDRKFTVSDTTVNFYASHQQQVGKIEKTLKAFIATLPEGSYFEFSKR